MAAIAEAILAPLLIQPTAGVVLICDQAMIESALVDGGAGDFADPAAYARLAAAVLRRTGLTVILHSERRFAVAAEIRGAREASCGVAGARLRVVEATPLEAMLPGVDLLVSFASPALIQGCWSGLKPVQIGRAVSGSASFSHVFPDVEGFVARLASGALAGRLTLHEYEQFEEFCRQAGGGPGAERGRRDPWRRSDDPIVRGCRCAGSAPPLSFTRKMASALTNPFAAWRLLRGNFPSSRTP